MTNPNDLGYGAEDYFVSRLGKEESDTPEPTSDEMQERYEASLE